MSVKPSAEHVASSRSFARSRASELHSSLAPDHCATQDEDNEAGDGMATAVAAASPLESSTAKRVGAMALAQGATALFGSMVASSKAAAQGSGKAAAAPNGKATNRQLPTAAHTSSGNALPPSGMRAAPKAPAVAASSGNGLGVDGDGASTDSESMAYGGAAYQPVGSSRDNDGSRDNAVKVGSRRLDAATVGSIAGAAAAAVTAAAAAQIRQAGAGALRAVMTGKGAAAAVAAAAVPAAWTGKSLTTAATGAAAPSALTGKGAAPKATSATAVTTAALPTLSTGRRVAMGVAAAPAAAAAVAAAAVQPMSPSGGVARVTGGMEGSATETDEDVSAWGV